MQELAAPKVPEPQYPMTFAEAREYLDDGVSDLT